jgi:hypothetical protein
MVRAAPNPIIVKRGGNPLPAPPAPWESPFVLIACAAKIGQVCGLGQKSWDTPLNNYNSTYCRKFFDKSAFLYLHKVLFFLDTQLFYSTLRRYSTQSTLRFSTLHQRYFTLLYATLPNILSTYDIGMTPEHKWSHDYYSIWFNFTANFFISEEKVWVIKLSNHYFISVSRHFFNKKMGNYLAQLFS